MRRIGVAALAATMATLVGHGCPDQELIGFYNIVPPGQDGVLNAAEAAQFQGDGTLPPHVDDQLAMYEELVFQPPTPFTTAADLLLFFKKAPIKLDNSPWERTYHPGGRADVRILRDAAFGVPHVRGQTRYGTMFGLGYAEAEDRLFLMDVLRRLGRARVSEFLGASQANRELDADQLAVAPYVESDLTAQIQAIGQLQPDGPEIVADAQAWVDGVNQYVAEARTDADKLPGEYPALQVTLEDFVLEDIVAVASLVGGIFGKGGGGEVRNYCGLQDLTSALDGDATTARAIFDDLKFADDPEAPTTAPTGNFPYPSDLGPVDPNAIPDLDCASLQPLSAPPTAPLPGTNAVEEVVPTPPDEDPTGLLGELGFPTGLSNAVLIGKDQAEGGVPIAVFGPQTGYFIPQLLVEKAVAGPGMYARGVSFAGTGLYVQLGRTRTGAWSATSAGADNVDHFILKLCEPGADPPPTTIDSMGYEHDGQCKPIEAHTETYVAKPGAAGFPPEAVTVTKHFERAADYGPLQARGTLQDGTPIAVAVKRTTYLAELESARGFKAINDPKTTMRDALAGFRSAMGEGVDYTFNWFWVDRNDIAYQHSCKCPRRAAGVDPVLPTWGTGAWDWNGFIGFAEQPHAENPAQGFLTSWNNKQAAGFLSNDRNFGYGPIYRSDMLDRRIQQHLAQGPLDVAETVVDVMELAGTTDLRAQEVLPLLALVMGPSAPAGPGSLAQQLYDLVVDWAANDDFGHRRDFDADGHYDNPQAVAVMDAWWPRLVDEIFHANGSAIRALLGIGAHDAPQNHLGSAFQGGLYGQVHKDLRQVLGQPVLGPFSRTYCGDGVLAECQADLWASLDRAAADLAAEFASNDPADWKRTRADDEVQHSAVGIAGVPPIHWINRPTFQQVVQVGNDLSAP